MDRSGRAAAIEGLYKEIFEHYTDRDDELVQRRLIPAALDSRILLLGQALAEKTQRLSGILLPPATGASATKQGWARPRRVPVKLRIHDRSL